MADCGRKILRAVTNVGLWVELSEFSDQWRIVDGTV